MHCIGTMNVYHHQELIILNFKHARLEWERLVLSGERMLHGNKEELIL